MVSTSGCGDSSAKSTTITYIEEQLVSFGNYMVSEQRKKRYSNRIKGVSKSERLAHVNHADVENWKHDNKLDFPVLQNQN